MKQASISMQALKAAICVVNNERPQINGVLIEVHPTFVNYIATDGKILFGHQELTEENSLVGNFIIPADVVKAVKLAKRYASYAATLQGLFDKDNSLVLTLKLADGISHGFRPLEGDYPDWRAVVPKTFSGVISKRLACDEHCAKECSRHEVTRSGYDPTLLAKLWKAFELMGFATPVLTPNDIGPALVRYGYDNNCFGLIMPIRVDTQADKAPDWVKSSSDQVAEEKAA